MKSLRLLLVFALLAAAATAQNATFRTLPSGCISYGMSPSGTFITGINAGGCFIYKTADSTLTNIGGEEAYGITDAGIVGGSITGTTPFGAAIVGAVYNPASGWNQLPTVPGGGYVTGTGDYSYVFGISDGGESVCGMFWVNGGKTSAYVYNVNTGYTVLQDIGQSARANCISGDGLVAGGWWQDASRVPIRWSPYPSATTIGQFGEANGTNTTGSYVAASDALGFGTAPIIWDAANNSAVFIPLPVGAVDGEAMAVSDNRVVVGTYSNGGFGSSSGFVYIPAIGTVDLVTYLTSNGASFVTNCGIPQAISRNGRYVCGLTSGFPRTTWFADLGQLPTGIDNPELEIHTLMAYPNPVAANKTTLSFDLKKSTDASLSIFDSNGKLVRSFAMGQLSAGKHEQSWDLTSENGSRVAAGKYFAILNAGSLNTKAYIIVQ
jgi:hypothetical protein